MAKQKEVEEMRPIKGRFTKTEFIRIARPTYKEQTELIFEQFLNSGKIEPIGVAGIEGKVSIFYGEQGRANESGPMSLVIVECHI